MQITGMCNSLQSFIISVIDTIGEFPPLLPAVWLCVRVLLTSTVAGRIKRQNAHRASVKGNEHGYGAR